MLQAHYTKCTYFLKIPKNVLNLELSSGTFFATEAVGGVDVPVEGIELAAEGAGEGRFSDEPEEDRAMCADVRGRQEILPVL
jgi:hypothetical protein